LAPTTPGLSGPGKTKAIKGTGKPNVASTSDGPPLVEGDPEAVTKPDAGGGSQPEENTAPPEEVTGSKEPGFISPGEAGNSAPNSRLCSKRGKTI